LTPEAAFPSSLWITDHSRVNTWSEIVAKVVSDSANARTFPGGLGMARHEIHEFRDRRPPRPVFVVLGLGLWLVLGVISQAAFQVLG
jgi:hypothetical protein